MRQSFTNLLLISLACLVIGYSFGQDKDTSGTKALNEKLFIDSTFFHKLGLDSLVADTPKYSPYSQYTIDSTFSDVVDYDADDSLIFDYPQSTVYLYGNAVVTYQDIELKADFISFNYVTNNVSAHGVPDTSGTVVGKPIFKEKDQTFDADSIKYNFKTRKGIIKQIGTGIADGHVYGSVVKKTATDVMYIKNGEYCPCEDENAKTRIHVNKLKVIPDKRIITGPWFLKIGKVPTPLGFFLGYFPNNKKESAGILVPRYGESNLGFFLVDGGWYQPLGANADLQLTGDIYTKGSFGFGSIFRYKNRYRFSGNLDLSYNVIKSGFEGLPNASTQKNTFVRWSHIQDPKANPNSTFNASVNIGSNNTFRNTVNTNINDFLTSTFQSNIAYSRRFAGKPYNVAISASHSQNTQTGVFNLTLPRANFNLQRVNLPLSFLKKEGDSRTRWFENIGFNYSATAENRISANESALRLDSLNALLKSGRNGINQNANLSTNLNAGFFVINPNISFNNRTYFSQISQDFDPVRDQVVIDTIRRVSNVYDYSLSTQFTTKVYGMYRFKKGKVKAIRHVLIPSASLNYAPAFDVRQSGFVGDSATFATYDPYRLGIFGSSPFEERGGVSLSLQNNVEAKVASKDKDGKESTKKVKLIDAFTLRSAYDIFRDSLKWSNISSDFRTVLFNKVNVTANGVFNPYSTDSLGRNVDASLYKTTGKLARLTSANLALGYQFNLSDVWDKFNAKTFTLSASPSFNYTYSQRFSEGAFQKSTTESFQMGGDIKFLTRFTIGFNTGYDFVQRKTTPTFLSIYVDMNCWELRINYVPSGVLRSIQITLNMKSAILKDVKLERRRNLTDSPILN